MVRTVLACAALVLFAAVPATAEDGRVSQSTLNAVGLSGMHVMSDVEGSQIRGQASFGLSSGRSLVFGQLIDPVTGSFIVVSDTNGATGGSVNLFGPSLGGHVQGSSAGAGLSTSVFGFPAFSGVFQGGAGGFGIAGGF